VFLNGAGRDYDGANLGTMAAEDGEIALVSRCGDAEDTKTKGSAVMAVGRDESNATGLG
jgi:hypothetical protein